VHWHTETKVEDLGATPEYRYDLTPSDDPNAAPDDAVVDAAYGVAQTLATAIGAPAGAFVTLDRVHDALTSAQSISVTVTVA
jgi:hypothetical protein